MARPLAVLVRGDDPTLRSEAVRTLVDDALGGADRSLAVSEFAGEEYALAEAVDAAQTPPMLTPCRVVVVRNLERFANAEAVAPLVAYLADPLESTTLVAVWDAGGRIPKALTDALAKAGADTIDSSAPSGRARQQWLTDQFARAPVRLDRGAERAVAERLGEDLSRLPGLLAALASAFGPSARLSVEDVAPFLGAAGSAPPWELTDAIDRGDPAAALERLHRLLEAGERHPLQVMVSLHSHFARMLRLHGSGAGDERAAAAVLGLKGSTFPARKALGQARKLGGPRIGEAITLLAEADLDLKGRRDLPAGTVMEVLVARLARLSR
ncbi:MAG: DNA polymerase III subunit delta [Acidimicrobiales bacterium]